MSPQATQPQTRTRTRPKSVRINDATEAKLDKLAGIVAAKYAGNGGLKVEPTHSQLIEALLDSALESESAPS